MMKNIPYYLLLLPIVSLGLTACSQFTGDDAIVHNYNRDYQRSTSLPPLEMPAGTKISRVASVYPAPSHPPKYTGQPSLIPPGNPSSAKTTQNGDAKTLSKTPAPNQKKVETAETTTEKVISDHSDSDTAH